MLISVILEQNVLQKWNILFCGLYLADKIRKEELLLSIALSEYKQVIFDILTPMVEGAKITLTPIKGDVKDK